MSMPTAIQQAFRPFFVTYFFIGLGVYPVKEPRSKIEWTVYLSILYSLKVWFLYGYLWYYMVNSLSMVALFRATITKIGMGINIVTTIISVILNVYYNKRFKICMKKLTAVDDTLEELGNPKIYRKMYMWSKRMIAGWIVYSFAINFCDILWWLKRDETARWAYIIPHLYNYCFHVNTFVDLVFIVFMWYLGTRFDKVNENMHYLLDKEEYKLKSTWKKPEVIIRQYNLYINNYKQILWTSMHLHLELCHIARELNLMFGTQMTLEMTSHLTFFTGMCYYLYGMIMRKNPQEIPTIAWLPIFSWIITFILRLFIINYICENVSVKANKIDKIIHQWTNTLRYADVWKEIYQFALQIMHHPLKFTGMGLFYLGNEFFRKFCLTITTFMIIIVQMIKV